MHPKDADEMENNVNPDQTAPLLGVHCFLRPICLSSYNFTVYSQLSLS